MLSICKDYKYSSLLPKNPQKRKFEKKNFEERKKLERLQVGKSERLQTEGDECLLERVADWS